MIFDTLTRAPAVDRLVAVFSGQHEKLESLTGADWEELIESASKNNVLSALYPFLRLAKSIPAEVLEKIKTKHMLNVHRNLRLQQELGRLQKAFKAVGVVSVPMKGAWFAEEVYRNIGIRKMDDIDLWIRREQIDTAREMMESRGYEIRGKSDRPQALQDELAGETQCFKTGAPLIELHWIIFHGEWLRHTARIDESLIWERTRPQAEETVRHFEPEDALILACVHLSVNHQMDYPLRTLLDIEYLRRHGMVNWETVAQRARQWRVATPVWLLLQMLKEFLGDAKDELPLRALAPSDLRQSFLRWFFSTQDMSEGFEIRSGSKRFIFLLALVDHPLDALRLVWRSVFPDRLWLTLRYGLEDSPAWRIWLQRLWHPLRTAWHRKI